MSVSGLFTSLFAQQIQLIPPDGLSVCDEASLTFEVSSGGAALEGAELSIQLPCGFTYVPGSVVGGSELSDDDPSRPELALPALAADETQTLEIGVQIGCAATACIDNGNLFAVDMELAHSAGTLSASSAPFNVETPYLLITSVDEPYWEGSLAQGFTRRITVRNTRPGALAAFEFEDVHNGDISISSPDGETVVNTPTNLLIRLGPSDFMQVGDGDGWFEFNEELVIREEITVEECSFNPQTVVSDLTVRWGCGADYCQSDRAAAQVKVVPDLSQSSTDALQDFEALAAEPSCYDGGRALQRLHFRRNTQAAVLNDFELTIRQTGAGRGIAVGSISHPLLNEAVYHDASTNSCGDSVSQSVTLYLDAPTPGSLTEIVWETAYCTLNQCNPEGTFWTYDYSYRKACAAAGTQPIQGSGTGGDAQPIITGALSIIGTMPPQDGSAIEVLFAVENYSLDETSGTLQVQLILPRFLVLQLNNNFLLGGQLPIAQEVNTIGDSRIITLEYTLPLNTDEPRVSVFTTSSCSALEELPCKDTIITNCPSLCSSESDTSSFYNTIAGHARVVQDPDCSEAGQLLACDEIGIPYPCFDGVCPDTLQAYFDQRLTLERTSLGWPDKNGDGQPDADGEYDESLLRLDRMAPGDTFKLALEGVLVTEQPGLSFDQLLVQLSPINSSLTRDGWGNIPARELLDYMLGTAGGIEDISSQVAIYDASAATWYELGNVPGLLNQENASNYDLSMPGVRDANPSIPFDFRYAAGDSVRLELSKRVAANFSVDLASGAVLPPTAQTPYPEFSARFAFDYRSRIYLDTVPFEERERFLACNCQTAPIAITNLSLLTWQGGGGGQASANCMEALPYSSWHRIISNLEFEFPGEIRPFHRPRRLRMAKYDGVVVDSLEVRYFEPPQPSVFLQPSEDANFYYFDFPESTPYVGFHPSTNDRYMELRVHRHFAACVPVWPEDPFNGRQALDIELERTAVGELYMPETVTVRPNWVGPRYNAAEVLDLQVQAPEQTFLSAEFELDLELLTPSPDSDSLTYGHLYLRPVYNGSQFEDIALFNAETGEEYTAVNGYFQLGGVTLPDTLALQLRGRAVSCEQETLYLEYGFDCAPVSDPGATPCALERDSVRLSFPPGLIDLLPAEGDISGMLCDTMPRTEALLFNAELGSVYGVVAEVKLPQGLYLLPGSCTVEYPAGSGQLIPIADPEPLGNRTFAWALADLWPLMAEQGLPGVNSDPANAFYLRFDTQTDCDFISGTRIIHRMVAEQVCGEPTNEVAKVSGRYEVEGIEAPYSSNLNVDFSGNLSCGDTLFLTATFEAAGDNATNLYVGLPEALQYVPGSTGGNADYPEPTLEEGQLQWTLLPTSPDVTLTFQLVPETDLDCSVPILSNITTAEVPAFCVSEGENCDIEVVTGEANLPLSVEKATYEILTAEVSAQQSGGLWVQGSVQNIDNPNGLPLQAGIYLDLDGDGAFSAADSLWQTTNLDGIATVGGTSALQATLPELPRVYWCDLLLVLEAEPNCACNTVFVPLDPPAVAPTVLDLCWASSTTLGVEPLPGYEYQWDNGAQLSCTQCPTATFTADNTGDTAEAYSYTLLESEGGCTIEHPFELNVHPEPGILSSGETVCQGDTVALVASLGADYSWSGPGLLSDDAQSVQAVPQGDAVYSATVTDDFGCTSTDTVAVAVLPPPELAGASQQTFCIGEPVQLQIEPQPGFSYEWLNGAGRLSDVFAANPTILLQEDFVYELLVSNGACSRVFEVAVDFEQLLDIEGLNDSLLACLGDTLSVTLNGALDYQWEGDSPFFCITPNCSSVQFPVGFGESSFTVQATDENGCTASQEVVIQSVTDSVQSLQTVSICEGDSVNIAGDWVSAAGLYCDTTVTTGSCVSVACTEVVVLPTWRTDVSATICESESYDFFGQALTESGSYTHPLSAENGCDSLIVLELEVLSNVEDQRQAAICEGDTLSFEGQLLTAAGTYTAAYPAANGCDSIITMDLSVRPAYDQDMQVTICEGETYTFNGEVLSEAGTYLSEGQTQFGCDSLVSLQLTVQPPKETFLDTVLCADERMVVGGQTFDAAGDYTIPLTGAAGCDSIVYLMLDYFPAPAYEAMTMPDFGLDDGMITLSLADSSWVVEWPDGGNELQRGGLTAGEYAIDIIDEWGCVTTVSVGVDGVDMIVDMPNTFTPNGDGTNDYFYPVTNAKGLEVLYFVVFNRWGQKVYDNEYPDRGWDGVFNGKPQPSEVYYYLVEVRVAGGVWRDQGDVTLVR